MNWLNYNTTFRNVALEQGIEIGSPEWTVGGDAAWAASTGSQPSYGWRHDHKVLQGGLNYVKAVIANYCSRPIFYGNCIGRNTDYDDSGRPHGYIPELPGDTVAGGVHYEVPTDDPLKPKIINVTGPDILHFHISPLIAVYDTSGYGVLAHGKLVDAKVVAGITLTHMLHYLSDACVKENGQVETYVWSDRGSACLVESVYLAAKRGLINVADYTNLYNYITKTLIPFYEKPPLLNIDGKGSNDMNPPFPKGFSWIQIYNQLYWALPAFYDLLSIWPDNEFKTRLQAIVSRWSWYISDLESLVPGKGGNVNGISADPNGIIAKGIDKKAVPNWISIKVENIHFSGDVSLWGLRALDTAAKVLESDVLQKAADISAEKWKAKNQYDDKAWLVGADGEYL